MSNFLVEEKANFKSLCKPSGKVVLSKSIFLSFDNFSILYNITTLHTTFLI